MNQFTEYAEEVFNCDISGYRRYLLGDPVRAVLISENLCSMLGYTRAELPDGLADPYAALIYPSDRPIYTTFFCELRKQEQTLTAEYRVVCKSGDVMYVKDTATSRRMQDGTFAASAVLQDITELKTSLRDLQSINETVPHGFMRYTCEKHPRIDYLNEGMKRILRFPKEGDVEADDTELYRENIYLMIPMEERARFSRFLERVSEQNAPLSGQITVLRCDGSKARLYGWVAKIRQENGDELFQSVCMDITEQYRRTRASETERYLHALSEVYDKIIEYDFSARTVRYLYSKTVNRSNWPQNIPMDLEEATVRWVQSTVEPTERERVLNFFRDSCRREVRESDGCPPQIRYRAYSTDGEIRTYAGIFLKMDPTVSYFCCRRADETDNSTLRDENASLRDLNENMQELMMRFTEGIVAFEVEDDLVKPLYASENVCGFFGYSKEEWLSMAEKRRTVREFVSKSGVAYEQFLELFERGEAEFEYYDMEQMSARRIKAVCSGASAKRYVMLYNIGKQNIGGTAHTRVRIRTFGYFDVFVDEKPIAFRNKKSKELYALLVDRRGGYVSSEEAIGFLWEDEPVSAVTLARYRKVALRLKNILEEYGIADTVESVDGKRRIVSEKVQCDLFDYLEDPVSNASLFKGSYLSNYSWGENTLGELAGELV